jgi:AraC-like DNA-binding protein
MPAARPIGDLPDPTGRVFDSSDPERTEAFVAAAFGNAMTISRVQDDDYRFQFAPLGAGPLHFNRIDHTATDDLRAEALPADLAVVRIHRGVRTNIDLDDRLGPGGVSLNAHPGQPYHSRTVAARFTAILVPMQAAAETARIRPDDELCPLTFHSLRPAHPAAARRWLQTVDYIAEGLRADPEAMTQPLLAGAAARLLAASLLSTFPNTWVTEPHPQDRTDATPTTLSRAIAFIEENADLDITVADVARAAYVTVRAVQLAFRRYLDTTPMAFLRRVRLERTHEQLLATAPQDGTTIAQIAARWGFADPSRFSALYSHTYGELPSHTLRS